MSANFTEHLQDGWTRFYHGEFECTVVTDGLLAMGAPHPTFIGATEDEINYLLHKYFLEQDKMSLNQNVLLVNTGEKLVLFDPGSGINRDFGVKTFGNHIGKTIPNMKLAGIEPESIDIIALTHTHPDHVWGLVDDDNRPLYPNARLAVPQKDFAYWTNLGILSTPEGEAMSLHMRDHFLGAHKNLMPYYLQGRIDFFEDQKTITPGIIAYSAAGHSPGHSIYHIVSQGKTLVVWGDICHHPVLLLEHPEWGFMFDYDKIQAAETRQKVFKSIEEGRHSVLSYHFPFPGRGNLISDRGTYRWVPTELEL